MKGLLFLISLAQVLSLRYQKNMHDAFKTNCCPTGYSQSVNIGFGYKCHSICPFDWRDDGLFCRKAEYGRGAGYAWIFGDALNDNGMFFRCQKDHGQGNCQKNGLIVYPKCKKDFSAFGCCICRPTVPQCRRIGLNDGFDLSCAKIGRDYIQQCEG